MEYFHEALPCLPADRAHALILRIARIHAAALADFYLCCPVTGLDLLYFPWQYRPLYWIAAHTDRGRTGEDKLF